MQFTEIAANAALKEADGGKLAARIDSEIYKPLVGK